MPSLPTITKTNSVLSAWTDYATGAETPTEIASLTGSHRIALAIQMGRRSGTAFTSTALPSVIVQASFLDSGNAGWIDIDEITFTAGTSIANTTQSGNVTAPSATFGVAAATNIAVGDMLYLHSATAGNCEIVRVKGISGTTITPVDSVVFDKASGAAVTDQAEQYFVVYDLTCYKRLRCVVQNRNSGQTIAVRIDQTLVA